MNSRQPTSPLDTEERALAERIARLGPHGEPSPALDAKVLAAAHAAANAAPPRRHARWPLGLGVAASLALALGLAWQLRPLPGADPAAATVAADSVVVDAAPAEAPAAAKAMAPPPAAVPKPAPVVARRAAAVADAPVAETTAPSASSAPPAPPPPAPPPPQEPAVVFDRPAPMDAMQQATAVPQGAARNAVQAAATDASAAAASEADAPEADVPPATVASPEVRDAWLARIRALVAAGRVDEARASLEEFEHRYPRFVLPEDLRGLRALPAP